MRIVDRQTFLSLPCPTVYIKIKSRWLTDELLSIKIGNMTNDWTYQTLNSPDGGAKDSGDQFVCLDEMTDQGVSYPIDRECAFRDGCFNSELFMIYEKEDIKFLIQALTEVYVGS
jgi:hypothetical protein